MFHLARLRSLPALAVLSALILSRVGAGSDSHPIPATPVTAEASGRWKALYDGEPFHPMDLTRYASLLSPNLMASKSGQCGQAVQWIWDQVMEYGRRAARADSRGTEAVFAEINTRLFEGRLAPHSECYDLGLRTYVLAASALQQDELIGMERLGLDAEGGDQSQMRFLPLLVAALLNQDQMVVLDESLRQAWGDGGWLRPRVGHPYTRSGHEYELVSAYDCSRGRILIDPYAHPFNLQSRIRHEIEHYVRDKASLRAFGKGTKAEVRARLLSWLEPAKSKKDGEIDWVMLNFADEALAVLTGFQYERRVLDAGSHKMSMMARRGFVDTLLNATAPRAFHIKNDLDFLVRGGPVDEIWNALHQSGFPPGTDELVAAITSSDPKEAIAIAHHGRGLEHEYENLGPKIKKQRALFLHALGQPYFPTLPDAESFMDRYGELFYPTSRMLETGVVNASLGEGGGAYGPSKGARGLKSPVRWSKGMSVRSDLYVFFDMENVFDNLEHMVRDWSTESPLCELYADEIEAGKIRDYVGLAYQSIPLPEERKTLRTRARDGDDESSTPPKTRPGIIKPDGGSGVKGMIHPCVWFNQEF